MDFDYIELNEYGTMAGYESYTVKKDNDGVVLEYAYVNPFWNNEKSEEDKDINIIRSVKKDLIFYETLKQLLYDNDVEKWDGFSKTNSHVLDGGGFNFKLQLNGETKVSASGSNSYPKHYGDIASAIRKYILIDDIKDNNFETGLYTCVLPDKWLNTLNVRYSDDYCAFFATTNDDQEKSVFIIYNVPYEFSNANDYILISKYDVPETTYYMYAKIDDGLKYYNDKVTDAQKNILETLQDDCNKVIESIKLKEYKFINE